jgi:membrane associated rhomboid family serine protease
MVEGMIGTKLTAIIYFAGGLGGNLLSAWANPSSISVGASSGICGILGAFLAYIIVNWKALDYPGSPRCAMLCFVIMIIIMNLFFGGMGSFTGNGENIDNYAHAGGLLVGTFAGMALIHVMEGRRVGKHEKNVKFIGIFSWAGYYLLGFSCFYTLVQCPNYGFTN